MKNNFLFIGGLLLLINTAAGIIYSSYNSFNVGLTDFSIILTSALIYLLYNSSRIVNGFKIGFTIFFSLTGLGRFTCALVSTNQLNGNISIFVFIILLAIELFCFFFAGTLKNK
jgi:hypothetical protein